MDPKFEVSRRSAMIGASALFGGLASSALASPVKAYAAPATVSTGGSKVVHLPTSSGVIRGFYEDGFQDVVREFERNFTERREVGASACVMLEGRTVVDVWGGKKNDKEAWERDTIVTVYSTGKGITAICAHLLASQKIINFDDPVGKYWPAFKSSDKNDITVRMLMNMSSGLVGTSHKLTLAELLDWDHIIRVIEKETPVWSPGSRWGYHGMTYGFLVGEVVRRVSGMSLGSFLRDHVARPADADFFIGVPASEDHRVAPTIVEPWTFDSQSDDWSGYAGALKRGDPIQTKQWNSLEAFMVPGACDAPGAHQAEIPAANGAGNARGIARIYHPLARPSHEVTFVSGDQHQQMIEIEGAGIDAVTMEPERFSNGFERGWPGTSALKTYSAQIHSESSFGFSGFGGSLGFADPETHMSFGYAMNRFSNGSEPYFLRAQSMVDAMYKKLGYVSKASGRWRR